jgi:galactokinase
MNTENIRAQFAKRFGGDCQVFRAPGRVNLIGEHTDYNEGFVMPVGIGFDTYVACAINQSGKYAVASLQENETATFPVDDTRPVRAGNWTDYTRGVLALLAARGIAVTGANLLVDGRVPIGAGLSSSAAIEVATAITILDASGESMGKSEIAQLCRQAENEFVGSRCGIMDQFTSLFSTALHALLLDCRSLETRYLPLLESVSLVICNTMVKHSLASGEYNTRRSECEAAVRHFASKRNGIRALRDVTEQDLMNYAAGLSPVLRRRCRHVVTENARVLHAAEALISNEMELFGKLMYESHNSLRDDYEVSCSELDMMVNLARTLPGVFGARMTGGGFGGCTINLVEAKEAEKFRNRIQYEYKEFTGILPEVYITKPTGGAGPGF